MSETRLKSWEISASTGSHFDVLDGLRGVAILLVVAGHIFYTNPAQGEVSRFVGYIFIAGWMGVPVFFVLSGFLISLPFLQKRELNLHFCYPRGYARRRLGKIIPPFYLSIVVFLILYWWQFHDPTYLESAWKWATGLANFVPIPVPFNLSYWSLLVEAHFYIVLPLLFWLTRGRTVRTTTLFIFLVLFIAPLLVRHFTWPSGLSTMTASADPLAKHLGLALTRFPCQLDYFAWGVLFAGLYVGMQSSGGRLQVQALSVLGYVGAGLLVISLILWGMWTQEFDIREHPTRWSVEVAHFLPALASLLLLFFIFDPQSLGARFLGSAPLRFAGLVSFEWFLFHGPIVRLFMDHGSRHTNGNILAYAWKTMVPFALTFGLAVLVYRYFSLPILNWVRDSLRKT